jgi:two-component system chemotaxis response regulator CheY
MKRVLDVGQCVPDHAAIRRLLEDEFDVQVERTHERDDTFAALRRGPVDLVLINRKLDVDYSDGLEILRAVKADPAFAPIPVMLVSNYPDAQEEAVRAGAEPGFGKAQLGSIETVEKLRKFLL